MVITIHSNLRVHLSPYLSSRLHQQGLLILSALEAIYLPSPTCTSNTQIKVTIISHLNNFNSLWNDSLHSLLLTPQKKKSSTRFRRLWIVWLLVFNHSLFALFVLASHHFLSASNFTRLLPTGWEAFLSLVSLLLPPKTHSSPFRTYSLLFRMLCLTTKPHNPDPNVSPWNILF